MTFIVELEPGCWLAPWDGDPGRTLTLQNAESFESPGDASRALSVAQAFRPFKGGKVVGLKTITGKALGAGMAEPDDPDRMGWVTVYAHEDVIAGLVLGSDAVVTLTHSPS